MKMLKEICSKLKLYMTVHIMYTHPVSRLCVELTVTVHQKQTVCAAVKMYSVVCLLVLLP